MLEIPTWGFSHRRGFVVDTAYRNYREGVTLKRNTM